MGLNYKRYCSFVVGGRSYVIDPEDPSTGLRIKFEVKANTIQTPNWAHIRIYNLSAATAQLPKPGDEVTLDVGYLDNHGVVYHGTVRQALKGKETPVDTYLDVIAGDGDRAHNHAVVNKALAKGSTGKDAFDAALQEMQKYGVTIGFLGAKAEQALQQLKYPRAQALFGMARKTLRDLALSTKSTWSIQKGKLDFLQQDENKSTGVTLGPTTGLIGMPVETTSGVIIRCLINPTLEVNDLVTLDASKINRATLIPNIGADAQQGWLDALGTLDGQYRIDAIDWTGDTRGNEWYADLTTHGAKTGSPSRATIAKGQGSDDPNTGTR